jgi:hypothetical protein
MVPFSTVKLEKNGCFGLVQWETFFFPTAQTEKNWWKKLINQIGENI